MIVIQPLPAATAGDWREYTDWGIGATVGGNLVHIATVSPFPHHGNRVPGEGRANLNLIVAAPKLADALKTTARTLHALHEDDPRWRHPFEGCTHGLCESNRTLLRSIGRSQ